MLYMDHTAAFDPTCRVKALSFDKIDAVGGGKRVFFERLGDDFGIPWTPVRRGIENMYILCGPLQFPNGALATGLMVLCKQSKKG
jgi:hypothetical protein